DAAPDQMSLPCDVEPRDPGLPGVRAGQCGEDANGGGLARPVGSEQREHAATPNPEIDAGQDFHRAVGLLEAGCLDRQLDGHVLLLIRAWRASSVYRTHFTAYDIHSPETVVNPGDRRLWTTPRSVCPPAWKRPGGCASARARDPSAA